MRNNGGVAWYTWVFSGVGAAVAAPLAAWLLTRVRRKPVVRGDETKDRQLTGPTPASPPETTSDQQKHPAVAVRPAAGVSGVQPSTSGLIDALIAIPGMNDPGFRHTIYERLPTAVVQQLQMDRRARIELISLIDTFGQYPHLRPWQALLDRVSELLPAHPAVGHLADELTDLGLVDNSIP